ncbi:hypothetical protein PRIPAC_76744 [Pristionchus pacificus]|nr:hypothetical protein PRIPAC_76744 [Pristionchus pacificus]
MGKRKRPLKERQECPSSCVACGAAATGYHYEAPSCTSCKTFFRRTVLQEKLYTSCLKSGDCAKEESIRMCRACRFDKCVSGGMNPLLIVSLKNPEENPVVQKLFGMKGIDVNESSTSNADFDVKPLDLVVMPKRAFPSAIECKIDRLIGGLLHLEKAHYRLRESSFTASPRDGYRLDTVIRSRSILSVTYQDSPAPPCDPVTGFQNHAPHGEKIPWRKMWPYIDLLLAIEYMKTFEFFHYLSHDDKKALIRHASIMCAHLTLAYFSYENKSDITLHPDGSSPHNGCVSKDNKHERMLHHGIIQIIHHLELDKKEYVLLKALIVCNPAIEDLSRSDKEELEKERLKYSTSLMSYVMYRRGHQKGPAAFAAMMIVIDTLNHFMKQHKNWWILNQAMRYTPVQETPSSLFSDIFFY